MKKKGKRERGKKRKERKTEKSGCEWDERGLFAVLHTPLSSYLFVMLHRNDDPGDLFVTATQFKTHASSAAAAASSARRPSSSFVIQKSCTPFARNVILGIFDDQPQS